MNVRSVSQSFPLTLRVLDLDVFVVVYNPGATRNVHSRYGREVRDFNPIILAVLKIGASFGRLTGKFQNDV